MKILTVKNALKAAAILPLLSSASFALTLPMDLSTDASIVGTVVDGSPASPTADLTYVNNLLGIVGANTTQVIDGPPPGPPIGPHTYTTGIFDYSGTVSDTGRIDGAPGDSAPAGYIVIAKYAGGGGPSGGPGGDIVFYTGNETVLVPGNSADIFLNIAGQPFDLSGFRAYKIEGTDVIVPPEGVLPDGGATVMLLGGGLTALALIRRKLS